MTVFGLFANMLIAQNEQEVYRPDLDKIDEYVEEVYGQHKQELYYDDHNRIDFVTDLFGRIKIHKEYDLSGKDFNYLESVPVITKYNGNVEENYEFDPDNFNPLKYKMNIYNKYNTIYYKSETTGYVIVISSIK